jgi:hypothetical protein
MKEVLLVIKSGRERPRETDRGPPSRAAAPRFARGAAPRPRPAPRDARAPESFPLPGARERVLLSARGRELLGLRETRQGHHVARLALDGIADVALGEDPEGAALLGLTNLGHDVALVDLVGVGERA